MALFMPTFVIPDTRSGLGLGVIDATQDLTVSWKINGPSALVSYSITIYDNNNESTQLYTTGNISIGCPAYGTSSDGEPQIFAYTIPAASLSSAGITNGNEYKIIIQQWWNENDSVVQSSASVFVTRAAPTLTISTIGTGGVISTRFYAFTGNYAQAQGDVLNWFRWRIAYADNTSNPFFDSGNVSGTMDVSCYYDGFFTGSSYMVRLTSQTENGVESDTGWVGFSASYPVSETTGDVTAGCVGGTDAVLVDWTGMEANLDPDIQGFALYRRHGESSELVKIAETDNTVFRIFDYGAASQQGIYTYYLFPVGATTYVSTPVVSGGVNPCWWSWTLMECAPTTDKTIFNVLSAFKFRLNIDSGAVGNNNTPNLLQNFTPYPKVQLSPSNYRSGTLSALLGVVTLQNGAPQYNDEIAWEKALYALSVSPNPLFIKNPKGDLIRIKLSAPVSMQTADATPGQIQTVSISWAEVGSADGISLYSATFVSSQEDEGQSVPQYYTDTADATATEEDIKLGETAYAQGEKLTGTAQIYVEGTTLFAPDGWLQVNS